MPRCNGSYIGIDANPNANVASGIWTVREAETYLRANKWPATPTVPSAPTGTAGDEQVALTWTAPTGGSTPTDYEVQYSSNGGSTWTTFSDGVSSATSAIVTGLTNGTGYIFRVKAVNILGDGPYGSASGTVTPAALNVALLLHFDGSNGSTTFTDSSQNAMTVTAYGDASISTAQSKFGGASAYFDGDDYAEASSETLSLGSADFTIECWVYDEDFTTDHYWFRSDLGEAQQGVIAGHDATNDHGCWIWLANEAINFGDVFVDNGMTENVWHHVAITRSGDTFRVFLDGVVIATHTAATPGDPLVADTAGFRIGGANTGSQTMTGYIDELRIVHGTAVYTGNFTPPTGPF